MWTYRRRVGMGVSTLHIYLKQKIVINRMVCWRGGRAE